MYDCTYCIDRLCMIYMIVVNLAMSSNIIPNDFMDCDWLDCLSHIFGRSLVTSDASTLFSCCRPSIMVFASIVPVSSYIMPIHVS